MAGLCVCPDECPESGGEPVCGSDAKTYPSECELQKAACGRDPKLPVLHVIFYGDCGERFAVAALSKILLFFSIFNREQRSDLEISRFLTRINVDEPVTELVHETLNLPGNKLSNETNYLTTSCV